MDALSIAPKLGKEDVSVSPSQREFDVVEEFDTRLPLLARSLHTSDDNDMSPLMVSSTLAMVATLLPGEGMALDLLSASTCSNLAGKSVL